MKVCTFTFILHTEMRLHQTKCLPQSLELIKELTCNHRNDYVSYPEVRALAGRPERHFPTFEAIPHRATRQQFRVRSHRDTQWPDLQR